MAKKHPQKRAKVLPPSKVTDVKLLSKPILIRKTRHSVDTENTQPSLDELLVKTRHYSSKVQLQALQRIEQFLKSIDYDSAHGEKILPTISPKMLVEDSLVREATQRIFIIIGKHHATDKGMYVKDALSIASAAITHTSNDVRISTLGFLKAFFTISENMADFSIENIECEKILMLIEKESLFILTALFKLFEDILLSKSQEHNLLSFVSTITKLISINNEASFGRNTNISKYAFTGFFKLFVRAMVVPSTIALICQTPSIGLSPKFNSSASYSVESIEKTEVLVHCFAHILQMLFSLFDTEGDQKSRKDLLGLANDMCFALQKVFEHFKRTSIRISATVIIQKCSLKLGSHFTRENAFFYSATIVPWFTDNYHCEKSLEFSKMFTLFLWNQMLSDGDSNYPSATTIPLSQPAQSVEYFRKTLRLVGHSGRTQSLVLHVLSLIRRHIEASILDKVDTQNEKECKNPRQIKHWEAALYPDLPFMLWRLQRRWSQSELLEKNGELRLIVQNAAISILHILRTYGGTISDVRGGLSPQQKMIHTLSKGCTLFFQASKNNLDTLNDPLGPIFALILRYVDQDVADTTICTLVQLNWVGSNLMVYHR